MMTNKRRYIEVARTSREGRVGELNLTLDIGERHAWFFKMEDGVLVLDHYVEQRRIGGYYNGIAWWNRAGRDHSSIHATFQEIVVLIPDDVIDEAESRKGGHLGGNARQPLLGGRPMMNIPNVGDKVILGKHTKASEDDDTMNWNPSMNVYVGMVATVKRNDRYDDAGPVVDVAENGFRWRVRDLKAQTEYQVSWDRSRSLS